MRFTLPSLSHLLRIDAATCAGMAILLLAAATRVAIMTGLPEGLLRGAGLALAACAMLFAAAGAMRRPWSPLVATLIVGNVAWVVASLALLVAVAAVLTRFGALFVLVQATAVAVLAASELAAWRTPRGAAPSPRTGERA